MKSTHRKYALLSVYDKTGIVDFARVIVQSGYHIISTGGTAKVLQENSIPYTSIQEITGNPESFDGRMKTISFAVEGGILFDRDKAAHKKEATRMHIPQIDIVVCNLYPFEKTVADPHASEAKIIENIDVGGPTMIRAAAKNFNHVIVVVDPKDYQLVVDALHSHRISSEFRKRLAAKAFGHIAYYDAQISGHFSKDSFPEELTIPLHRTMDLRYGDNPDQKAAVYLTPHSHSPFSTLQQIAGRGLSATNITDIDAAIKVIRLFREPTAVVIKHNNPCGIGCGKTIDIALQRAIDADSESAFGGVVVVNEPLSQKAAQCIAAFKQAGKGQIDILAAPRIATHAVDPLMKVRKTTGVYTFGEIKQSPNEMAIKTIIGGVVIQTINNPDSFLSQWKTVTRIKPTKKQMEQMRFAWRCIARIKSNTVAVIDKSLPMTRGIGSGQTSRVLATKIALERAGKSAQGAILASDSFFPFDDSVTLAAQSGIAAIVQQGGSIRDEDSIRAADKAGIAMVFTNQRVFWH